jgi:hypothetical protein
MNRHVLECSDMPSKLNHVIDLYEEELATFLKKTGDKNLRMSLRQFDKINLSGDFVERRFPIGNQVSIDQAIVGIFKRDLMNIVSYRRLYLLILAIVIEGVGNVEELVWEQLKILMRQRKIRFIHQYGTDRFWRPIPTFYKILEEKEVIMQSIPLNDILKRKRKRNSRSSNKKRRISSLPMERIRQPMERIYRVKWSDDESLKLIAGIIRHGEGNWAAITRDIQFGFLGHRTNIDLKDRWRIIKSLVDEDMRETAKIWLGGLV